MARLYKAGLPITGNNGAQVYKTDSHQNYKISISRFFKQNMKASIILEHV